MHVPRAIRAAKSQPAEAGPFIASKGQQRPAPAQLVVLLLSGNGTSLEIAHGVKAEWKSHKAEPGTDPLIGSFISELSFGSFKIKFPRLTRLSETGRLSHLHFLSLFCALTQQP